MAVKISYLVAAIVVLVLAIRYYNPPETQKKLNDVPKKPNIVFILADDLVRTNTCTVFSITCLNSNFLNRDGMMSVFTDQVKFQRQILMLSHSQVVNIILSGQHGTLIPFT